MQVKPSTADQSTSSLLQTSFAGNSPAAITPLAGSALGAPPGFSFNSTPSANKEVAFQSPKRIFHPIPKRPAPEITLPPTKRVRTKRGKPQVQRSQGPQQAAPRQPAARQPPPSCLSQVDSLSTSISKLFIGPQAGPDSFNKSVVLLLSGLIENSKPIVPQTTTPTAGPRRNKAPTPIRTPRFSKSNKGPATASNALSISERRSKELFPLPKIIISSASVPAPPKTA